METAGLTCETACPTGQSLTGEAMEEWLLEIIDNLEDHFEDNVETSENETDENENWILDIIDNLDTEILNQTEYEDKFDADSSIQFSLQDLFEQIRKDIIEVEALMARWREIPQF